MQLKDSFLPPVILLTGMVFLLVLVVLINQHFMDKRALWDWEQYLANETVFSWDFSDASDVLSIERNGLGTPVYDEQGMSFTADSADSYFWLNFHDRLLDPKAYEFVTIEYSLEKNTKIQLVVSDIEGKIYISSKEQLFANENIKDIDLLSLVWMDVDDMKNNRLQWSELPAITGMRFDPLDQQGQSIILHNFSIPKGFEFIDARWFAAGELPQQRILGEFCVFQAEKKLLVPERARMLAEQSRQLCPNSIFLSKKVDVDALLDEDLKATEDADLPEFQKRTQLIITAVIFALSALVVFNLSLWLDVLAFIAIAFGLWLFAPLGYTLPSLVCFLCLAAVVLNEKRTDFLNEYEWGFGNAPGQLLKLIMIVTGLCSALIIVMPLLWSVDIASNWREGKHYFLHYPLWVIFQQLLIGPILCNILFKACGEDKNLILTMSALAAVVFAALHLPNTVLVFLTLPLGFVWAYCWLRYRCVWPQIISHIFLGTLFAMFAPQALRVHGEVGLMYFSYLW